MWGSKRVRGVGKACSGCRGPSRGGAGEASRGGVAEVSSGGLGGSRPGDVGLEVSKPPVRAGIGVIGALGKPKAVAGAPA